MKSYPTNLWKPVVALLGIFAAVAACTGSNSAIPSPSPNDVATVVAATMEAIQAQATPTSPAPTIAPSPTAPLLPPAPVLPAATRLSFVAEATAGNVTGTIQPGQTLYYVLNAAQGQPMIVDLNSTNNDVTMTIKTAGGTALVTNGQNLNMRLPITEDYYFYIYGGASSETFNLSIDTPSLIQFAVGKTSATISGKTAGGFTIAPPSGFDISYALFANQGQNMEIDLNGVGKNAVLAIYGFSDGQPYLRYVTEQTTFSMKLPSSQYYIIQVVPMAGMIVDYTIVVTVK
ncbi:MAG TPA: hypothetical protein VLX61_15740 [Anaerolineales bacterium]|nr:hypothetical protein [Anaerolineales bacterium]